MLSKDNNQLNIKWLCDVAGVSRSGFYSYRNRKINPSKKELQDREDFELILKHILIEVITKVQEV